MNLYHSPDRCDCATAKNGKITDKRCAFRGKHWLIVRYAWEPNLPERARWVCGHHWNVFTKAHPDAPDRNNEFFNNNAHPALS